MGQAKAEDGLCSEDEQGIQGWQRFGVAAVILNETKRSVSLILKDRTVKERMGKKSQSRRVFNIKKIKKKKKIVKTCRRVSPV